MPKRIYRLLTLALLLLLVACSGPNTGENLVNEDEVIVSDDVRVLGQDGRESLTLFDLDLTTGAGRLRFAASDPALDDLEPGLIVASEPVPGVAPHGFLQRIESKRTEGGQLIFETTQATLLETFDQVEINLDQQLRPANLVQAEALYEGVSFEMASEGMSPLASTGFDFNVGFDEVLIDGDGNESTTNDQLRVNGNFNFAARASAKIDIDCDCFPVPHPYLDLFSASLELDESVDVTISGEVASGFDESFEVARYDFGTFTVMAGPVPVVFVIEMVISIGANGQIEAHLEAGAVQSTNVKVGAKYTDSNGWQQATRRGRLTAVLLASP